MARVSMLLFIGALFSPVAQAADERPIVAVFDIQAKRMTLPQDRKDLLTSLLVEEMSLDGVFKVMPPGDVKKVLMGQSKESYKECYDESCQIQLGRQLPANKLLTSTVMKMGSKCRVSASLYDLRQQTSDTTSKVKGGCSEDELLESIEAVAAKMRVWGGGRAPTQIVDHGSQGRARQKEAAEKAARETQRLKDLKAKEARRSAPTLKPERSASRGSHEVFDTYKDRKAPFLALKDGPRPGRKARILAKLKDGTRLRVISRGLGKGGRWWKISVVGGRYDGQQGYVHSNWVRERAGVIWD